MTISTSATRGSSVLIRDIRNSGSCSSFFMANQIRQDRSCRALHSDSSHLQESKMALFGAGFIQCVHRHFLSPDVPAFRPLSLPATPMRTSPRRRHFAVSGGGPPRRSANQTRTLRAPGCPRWVPTLGAASRSPRPVPIPVARLPLASDRDGPGGGFVVNDVRDRAAGASTPDPAGLWMSMGTCWGHCGVSLWIGIAHRCGCRC